MRPHPLFIYYRTRRWLWILLIPLFRIAWMPGSWSEILAASVRDLLPVVGFLLYTVAKWHRTHYQIGARLAIRQTFPIRQETVLSPAHTALIAAEATPLMRLFRCHRVQVSTVGRRRGADAVLYLSGRYVHRSDIGAEGYHANLLLIAAMALSGSNAAIGAITLVPLIRKAASILGDRFPADLYSVTARFVSLGLPPILEGAANLLFFGWCFSVISSIWRSYSFRVYRHGPHLQILSGAFTHRRLQLNSAHVAALLLRQTLFSKLPGLYTVTVTCAGYGREVGVRPVLIPAATRKALCRALDQLLPGFPLGRVSLRPSIRSLPRYILPPMALLAAAFALYLFSDVITVIPMLLVLLAGIWWFLIRLIGFFYSGFGITDQAIVMRYPHGLALYELHLPLRSVDRIRLVQSPWQRKRNRCTLKLRCFGEKRHTHRIWGLDRAAVEDKIRDKL